MIKVVVHKELYIRPKDLIAFIKDNQPINKDSDAYNFFINNEETVISGYLNHITDYDPFVDDMDINYETLEKELYNYLFN